MTASGRAVRRLVVHPVASGRGRSPFGALGAPVQFALVEAVTFKTGVIAKTLRPSERALDGPTQIEREKTT